MTFTSSLAADADGYVEAAERMAELAARQPGFLGMESRRDERGCGVTICYWASREAIEAWRNHPEHLAAKLEGKRRWYAEWNIRIDFVDGRA